MDQGLTRAPPPADNRPVLRVRGLRVRFQGEASGFAAVDGISFELARGGSLALIGESGSGKTTTALSLLRLLPPGARATGRIELDGQELLGLPQTALRHIRGKRMAMVFHDPLTALNPVARIGAQVAESLRAHAGLGRAGSRASAVQRLLEVGLPARAAEQYPHQLSGGMRQRALIAIAVACSPALLVADEPTSALDPVVQAQIVELLRGLRQKQGIALLVATHDLDLAAALCDDLAVLYGGRIVERGPTAELLRAPRHPYTAGLLRSLPPPLGQAAPRLHPIGGAAPPPWALPSGCRFRDRCPRAEPDCAAGEPELSETHGRAAACFHPLELA